MIVKKWTTRDAKKCIIVPTDLDHKYSRGVLGIITGSAQFPGAAVLTTKAASATGLGAIRFYSSSGLSHLVLHSSPEALIAPGIVTAWLAGSGIGDKKYSSYTTWARHQKLKTLKTQSVPTVLDAGALAYVDRYDQPTLITPHAGELSRLLTSRGEKVSAELIESDPKKWAAIASELFGAVVLLKGARTVIASEDGIIELGLATPWLATAGSGDVLSGIIGALVATNYIEILNSRHRLADVAATGAFIHSAAGTLSSRDAPISSLSIIDAIPEAIRKILR